MRRGFLPPGTIKAEFVFSQKEWNAIPVGEKDGTYEFYLYRIHKSNVLYSKLWPTIIPDVEKWIHSNEYIDGYKKESVHVVEISPAHLEKHNKHNAEIFDELLSLWNP